MRKVGIHSIDSEFCASALERALLYHGSPQIFITDQDVQNTSHEFTDILKDKEIKISMDGRGRAMDNIFIERLWHSVKYEAIYVNEFKSVEQLRKVFSRKVLYVISSRQKKLGNWNSQTDIRPDIFKKFSFGKRTGS